MPFHALAKQLDQEERRHKGQFPVDKPVEKVERCERAEQSGELQTQQGEVGLRAVAVPPRNPYHDQREQGGEEQDECVGAIEADVVVDAKVGNPGTLGLDCLAVELGQQPNSQAERHQCPGQRHRTRAVRRHRDDQEGGQ